MEIQIDPHTLERAEERGTNEDEIKDVCILWKMEGAPMNILYNDKTDLLYIRLDDRKKDVVNRRISDNIVLDIDKDDKIVGIEILDASIHVSLEKLLPINYEPAKKVDSITLR